MRIEIFHVTLILIFRNIYADIVLSPWTFSCKDLQSSSALLRLKEYLFCEYDTGVRPSDVHKNATKVDFELLLRSFEVDDEINIVDVHSWMILTWKDAHLTWNPASYEDILWLQVKNYEIWLPDIMVHSATDLDVSPDQPLTHCWVSHIGIVSCVLAQVGTAFCDSNHEWWPYDAMDCRIQYGSWSHSSEEIRLQYQRIHEQGLLAMDPYKTNSEWDLVRVLITETVELSKYNKNMDTNIISYRLHLKRHSYIYSSIYVTAAIVLMVLTLMTLWLEPKSMERMILANFNFICHLLVFEDLQWRIPFSGDKTPGLLLFCEKSFILATFSLILTSVLRHVQELNTEPPVWVSSFTASILHSKTGQILLLSILDPKVSAKIEISADDNTDLVSAHKKESAWMYVSILIGWLAFFAVLITYIVILSVHLPTTNRADLLKLNI